MQRLLGWLKAQNWRSALANNCLCGLGAQKRCLHYQLFSYTSTFTSNVLYIFGLWLWRLKGCTADNACGWQSLSVHSHRLEWECWYCQLSEDKCVPLVCSCARYECSARGHWTMQAMCIQCKCCMKELINGKSFEYFNKHFDITPSLHTWVNLKVKPWKSNTNHL